MTVYRRIVMLAVGMIGLGLSCVGTISGCSKGTMSVAFEKSNPQTSLTYNPATHTVDLLDNTNSHVKFDEFSGKTPSGAEWCVKNFERGQDASAVLLSDGQRQQVYNIAIEAFTNMFADIAGSFTAPITTQLGRFGREAVKDRPASTTQPAGDQ